MTNGDRDILIGTAKDVKEIHKVLFGNGQKGLNERFIVVEDHQKQCIKRRDKFPTLAVSVVAIASPVILKFIDVIWNKF